MRLTRHSSAKLLKKSEKSVFEICSKAAKYIGSGAIHTRARRYADVVQGKVTEEELLKQIKEKRNKDAVCALGLLTDRDDAAIQRRYLRIQQFLKESKQFGSSATRL